ncbi:hypothetical protein P280DRAFT_522795 [Massarina eburnea CBS 473.64]|uniref:Uncharacterized protein n=1 Tax=Massarina eburnea CBS 473.64 TaxID=1395130 RepID=A0A6A6RMB2_9PLEO|nr:hypothetical protein P280DRAFT_522795 [Massarina eburnea CBS 473.64]
MALPAEARNMIYGYALTSAGTLEGDIVQDPITNELQAVVRTDKSRIPFNQLKYTSKQLKEETEDLELQYNTLTFSKATHFSPGMNKVEKVLQFMSLCNPDRLSWITTVVLQPNICKNCYRDEVLNHRARDLVTLDNFCLQHPTITFKFLLEHPYLSRSPGPFNISLLSFLTEADLTSRKLRRRSLYHLYASNLPLPTTTSTMMDNVADSWRDDNFGTTGTVSDIRLTAPNLKFFPVGIEAGAKLKEDAHQLAARAGLNERQEETWINLIIDMVTNGL